MEKVSSLRTAKESAAKSYLKIKSKRIMNTPALRRAILVTFYINVTFSMQKSDTAKDDRLSGK
jgi:hypothetical protein